MEEVTFNWNLNDESKPDMQSDIKCFPCLRDSKNNGSELGDSLASPVTREGPCDQSLQTKGWGELHEAGTSGRDSITQHIPGHSKEFGFGSKFNRKPLKTHCVIFKECCIEGSRMEMGRFVTRLLKYLRWKMVWTRQRQWHKEMERSRQVGTSLGGRGEPTALKDGLDVKARQTKHKNDSRVSGFGS